MTTLCRWGHRLPRRRAHWRLPAMGLMETSTLAIWFPEYDPIEVPIALGERKEVELRKGGKLQGIAVLRRQ